MRCRRTCQLVCGALAAAALPAAAEAGLVIYVDAAAPDGGDGSNWVMAFNDLQDALAVAVANDQIWVAAGVYTPAGPNGDREASFALVDNVPLFGGFAGWEEQLEERDWVANETILSGDLNGDDGPDFQNNDENSCHVVSAVDAPNLAWLDGFTVTGGNANVGAWGDANRVGGGVFAHGGERWVRHCTVRGNRAFDAAGGVYSASADLVVEDSVIRDNVAFRDNDNGMGGGVYCSDCQLAMANCHFEDNLAGAKGGALGFNEGGDATITGCTFVDNVTGVGGAIGIDAANWIVITDCRFVGNQALVAGALYAGMTAQVVDMTDCVFLDNAAEILAGAMIVGSDQLSAVGCLFAANSASFAAGAVEAAAQESVFINCVFSRNAADTGGGAFASFQNQFINCSFSNNSGRGITIDWNADCRIDNCILWGNTPEQIGGDCGAGDESIVSYSDVQGGWYGEGNIDADPLFVQPMADDLRLAFGSPCVNMGDNDAVPPYIETDILGNDRFIDGIVDMGAYEGQYEMLPPAAVEYDLDQGEGVVLIPDGGEFNPLSVSAAVVVNTVGPDNATAVITRYDENLHPEGEGFSVLGTSLQAETSLAEGQSRIQLFIPFDASDLGESDPATLDVAYFDDTAGTWALAVSRNVGDSPGHDGPIGDRIVVVDGGGWGVTTDAGDWGVFWDPQTEEGFVWANVDYPGEFAFGVPLCPPDCAQPPDGFVDWEDLEALLGAWSDGLGPFDVNNDGSVDVVDLLTVLASWGPCP